MWARHASNPGTEAGVALITVMLMLALLTAIVSRMGLLNQIWMRQVDNSSALVQASQATRAAQVWISSILEDDNNAIDGRTDDWAMPMIPIPIAWGEMYGHIEDMQSRFNLNNLIDDNGSLDPKADQQFRNLLQQLGLQPSLADAIVDWIDADSISNGTQGAEDLYYLGLERPYLAANRPFMDEQELRLIRSIDRETWNRLEPYITALPEHTPVNINTASAEVIAAVMYNPDEPDNLNIEAGQWVEDAQINPYSSLEDFNKRNAGRFDSDQIAGLAVNSSYFRAYTQMTFGSVEQRMATLYHREAGRASILHQSRTWF